MLLICWLAAAALFLNERWGLITNFVLGDTDDNMRMMQVRGLLAGQGWFDLVQHRLDPPFGADIHWSRLVDLPIAGLIMLLKPFIGGKLAETSAIAIAPMLPMGVALVAITLTAKRLIGPSAFLLAVGLLFCAHSTRMMWVPMRIDHHGWQLALLSLVMAGLCDPKRARGGTLVGIATALSLAIGLEMLLYLAGAGAILLLFWIRDAMQARRLAAYGATLAAGTAFSYLVFASEANRAARCDALSPVWLSVMLAGGALSVLLAVIRPGSWQRRLLVAAAGGAAVAASYAFFWPQCVGPLEGVSPEAQALWLSQVREARPVYTHAFATVMTIVTLPVVGLVGYAVMLWRNRRQETLPAWSGLAALTLLSTLLLLWQTRAGPAAQLLAVPGAAGLGWLVLGWIQSSRWMLVRVFGAVAAFAIVSGIGIQMASTVVPAEDSKSPAKKAVDKANGACPTLAALKPVALQPRGYVLTFVDLGPRLITVTHHDAVAGPYHRNYRAIVDVMKTFRGSPEDAHRMIQRRKIDYVLICPNMSEATVYRAYAPRGFYAQIARNKVPEWMEPVTLPAKSPYRMWRIKR